MADRETVQTWLEICGENHDCSGTCPYSENGFGEYGQCRDKLMSDALELLKEQKIGHWVVESKVSWREDYDDAEPVFYAVATCSECGKPYKWEVAKTYVDAEEWADTYNPNLETLNEKRMPIYNKALEEHKRVLQSIQYDWVSCPHCGAKMEKQP